LARDFGPSTLTSISSYTHRKVLVTRDATQLTGSVTYDVFGEVPQVRTSSPLFDHTHLNVLSQELRLSSTGPTLEWVLGGFYQHVCRRFWWSLARPRTRNRAWRLACRAWGSGLPFSVTPNSFP
jgi:iron complex outermembrane receptor protein